MASPFVIALTLCMALALLLVFENVPVRAQAQQPPLWSYQSSWDVLSISASSDGNYLVVGGYSSYGNDVCLFSRTDNTPLWGYTTGDQIKSVAISSDGFCD